MTKSLAKLSLFTGIYLLLLSLSANAQPQKGMNFEKGNWNEVLAKAKTQNKPIFVDAYTEWCGPCKMMAKQTFPNDSVGMFYNAHYLNFKLDMEKGEGPSFAKKYQVNAYPTLLYFNANGELVHRVSGARMPKEFILEGKNALDPDKQLITLSKKYHSGNRDPKLLLKLAKLSGDGGFDYQLYLEEFAKVAKETDYNSKDYFEVISQLDYNPDSEHYKRIVKNRAVYIRLLSADKVDEYIGMVPVSMAFQAGQIGDKSSLDQALNQIKVSGLANPAEYESMAKFYFYYFSDDKEQQYNTAVDYLNNYCKRIDLFGATAELVLNKFEGDKPKLNQASKWAQKAYDDKKTFSNALLLAKIYAKLGEKALVKQYAQTAKSLAQPEDLPNSDLEVLLQVK